MNEVFLCSMTIQHIYNLFLDHPKVITDSRKIEKGCLFFALKGDNFNGNSFAEEALRKGAAYAIIDDKNYEQPEGTLLTDNVLETLQQLAAYHRARLGIPVIGITGTNGKTTTKELLAAVLSRKFNVVCTRGNFNNHIGVPLTLLSMDENTEMGIVEMGANHAGEIAELCNIADPDYGIITNIGIAHLEGFGSFETIKETKAELYKHTGNKNGLIFYNHDNPVLLGLTAGFARKKSYGTRDSDITGELLQSKPFLNARVNFPEETLDIQTRLIGIYNFENLMAAAAVGSYFGIDPAEIAHAVSEYVPQNNRSQMIERNGRTIIMDAYNANPSSMKASIENFISVFQPPRSVILGDMRELGAHSVEEHRSVVQKLSDFPFDAVYLVGPIFTEVAGNTSFNRFADVEKAVKHIRNHPPGKGAILIKGSRGIQLEKIMEVL